MYPVALFLLLLLLAGRGSETTATAPYDDVGMQFIAVFPENIASYHPSTPRNSVQITALLNDTQVTVKEYNNSAVQYKMMAGQMINITLNATMELDKENISSTILTITSTNNITVQAISLKQASLQTALIIPTAKLGKVYLIPPIPIIPGTTDPKNLVAEIVTERNPFKVIVVNGVDDQNAVTVTGSATTQVPLQPGQLAQIWLQDDGALKTVKAEKPVAVLFGHPCAMQDNCRCGMLYIVLPPAPIQKLRYLIPPSLISNTEQGAVLLLADGNSTTIANYSANTPVLDITGTVILYRPGLLISLIPEQNFGACFVLNAIAGCDNYAVIVVYKNATDGVYVGKNPISSPNWEDLHGTIYHSTYVLLPLDTCVIWHSYSKMAVYFVGQNRTDTFGNPAPVISSTPDFRGCAVVPEVVEVGETADGWRESLKYCKDKKLEIVNLSNKTFQTQVFSKLVQTSSSDNNSVHDVWIGMRRHSLNGEWYWVNGDNVTDTNWDQNEPGGVDDGQCAIMSVEQGKEFHWRDDDCCNDAPPVCYQKPTLFPL